MVISYWEMVASIVNRGLITTAVFRKQWRDLGGWTHADVVPIWRAAFKNRGCLRYRRNVQAAGSLAREACAGVERGDAAA